MVATTVSNTFIPPLFISHGAPSVLNDGSPAPDAWRAWAKNHPRPTAIVALSAHRPACRITVGSAVHYQEFHDFGGFSADLYQLQYRPAGAPALARKIVERLRHTGLNAVEDADHRLDHGAWVPLLAMYPEADIPVIPLSVMPDATPAQHFALGQALADLSAEGVLLLASGSLTHNLMAVRWGREHPLDWVEAFRDALVGHLLAGNVSAALDYIALPHAFENHPTNEHLLPLYFALGAGRSGQAQSVYRGFEHAAIAMDVLEFV